MDLPDSGPLKDKRKTLRSIVDRVRSRFNVAVAEVDRNDSWQVATLGITCVSNYSSHANEMLSQVVSYVQAYRGDAVLADSEWRCSQGCRELVG